MSRYNAENSQQNTPKHRQWLEMASQAVRKRALEKEIKAVEKVIKAVETSTICLQAEDLASIKDVNAVFTQKKVSLLEFVLMGNYDDARMVNQLHNLEVLLTYPRINLNQTVACQQVKGATEARVDLLYAVRHHPRPLVQAMASLVEAQLIARGNVQNSSKQSSLVNRSQRVFALQQRNLARHPAGSGVSVDSHGEAKREDAIRPTY